MNITLISLFLLCCVRILRGEDAASNKDVILCDFQPKRIPEVSLMTWNEDYDSFDYIRMPDIEDCSLDSVDKICRALFTDVTGVAKLNEMHNYTVGTGEYKLVFKHIGFKTFEMQKFLCRRKLTFERLVDLIIEFNKKHGDDGIYITTKKSELERRSREETPKAPINPPVSSMDETADIPNKFWCFHGDMSPVGTLVLRFFRQPITRIAVPRTLAGNWKLSSFVCTFGNAGTMTSEKNGAGEKADKDITIQFTDLRSTLRTHWKSIYVLTIVAIIGTIQMSTVPPQVFPYMKQLDSTVSPTFYGYLGSLSSLTHVLAAGAAGWISNKINQTKVPIVAGKIFAITACITYLIVEYFKDGTSQRITFAVYEIFSGLSVGAIGISRAYVAMASTEEDRSKAISITTMAMPLGIVIGPVIQLLFTNLGYPGITLPTGGHINTYTAPVMFSMLCNIFAFFLLICMFKDKTTVTRSKGSIKPKHILVNPDKDFEVSTISSTSSTATEKQSFDWGAIITCLVSRLVLGLMIINMRVVATPYTMMVFDWSPTDAVFYHSLAMALVGAFGIIVHLIYIFTKITDKITERMSCVFALCTFILFYLMTYPWPFLTERLRPDSILEVLTSEEFNLTLPDSTENRHPVLVTQNNVGCAFSWCADTPKINFYVYFVGQILTVGTCMPIMMMNLDILHSKLLGNIKQGTMQGVFMISGDVVNIIGPIILSSVYEASGPTYIWMFLIIALSACTLLWVMMYARMVPNRASADGSPQQLRCPHALYCAASTSDPYFREMRCLPLVFTALYLLLWPVSLAHPMRMQGVAVKGRLVCGSEPLVGAKVKIIDVDTGMDPDDLLDEGYTDSEGYFELSGATREVEDISAVIKIYHDCNDGNKPCQRKVLWEVPSKYHNSGKVDQWFNVGTVNMEIKFRREERDCRH